MNVRVCILFTVALSLCSGENVLVSVQSQTREDMHALTSAVGSASSSRTVLGVVEATMSRVVDVDNPYLTTVPAAVPVLSRLGDVSYVSDGNSWVFEYNTMKSEEGSVGSFKRFLYFSKAGNPVVSGDTGNDCLQPGSTDENCKNALNAGYYPLGGNLVDLDTERVGHMGDGGCAVCSAKADLVGSAEVQTLTVSVPHSVVRDVISNRNVVMDPLGNQTEYTFGVGILFSMNGNNMVIFDVFKVVEKSYGDMSITKSNEYSAAQYLTFKTSRSTDNDVRLVTFDFMLRPGHKLATGSPVVGSVDGVEVTEETCRNMQTVLQSKENMDCLASGPLCVPRATTVGSSVWVSVVFPLPQFSTPISSFAVNLLITTANSENNIVMSSLNFHTAKQPAITCLTTQMTAHDITSYTKVDVYQGTTMQKIGSTNSDFVTVTNTASVDSLLLIRLKAKDNTAKTYLADTGSRLNLDDVYMSHLLDTATVQLPSAIANTADSTQSGRSQLTLDPELLAACPMESGAVEATVQCVTTHDYAHQPLQRPGQDGAGTLFVVEYNWDNDDKTWLTANVFGNSDAGNAKAQEYIDAIGAREQHERVFLAWPVYAWPDRSPVGLKDSVVLSFTWSITRSDASSGRRRLLSSFWGSLSDMEHSLFHKKKPLSALLSTRERKMARERMNNSQVHRHTTPLQNKYLDYHAANKNMTNAAKQSSDVRKKEKDRRLLPNAVGRRRLRVLPVRAAFNGAQGL